MNMFKLKKSDLIYFSLIVYLYVLLFGGWFLKVIGLPTNLTLIIVKAIDFFPILYWIILNPVFLLTFKTSSFKISSIPCKKGLGDTDPIPPVLGPSLLS